MRRLTACFIAYAVSLVLLFHIAPGRIFLAPVLLFFLCGIALVSKEYHDSIEALKNESGLRLKNYGDEKKNLEEDIGREDGRLFELRNKETMMAALYEITKKMSQNLTFNEIFDVLSIFLREHFIFKKSELIILKETEGYIKVDKVYKLCTEAETDTVS